MADTVVIPLAGIGTLRLERSAYEAALTPVGSEIPANRALLSASAPELIDGPELARRTGLPVSFVMEGARRGRIPCVRAGRYVRFDPSEVISRLRGGDQLVDHQHVKTREVPKNMASSSTRKTSVTAKVAKLCPAAPSTEFSR